MNHWVYEDPLYFRAWMYILLRANWQDGTFLFGKALIKCKRGQFVTSIRKFSEATGMTEKQVRLFWDTLVADGMLGTEKGTRWTQITVCNYDDYQGSRRQKGTPKDDERATDKEYKEVYKEYLLQNENEKYKGFVKFLFTGAPNGEPFIKCLSLPKGSIRPKDFETLVSKYPRKLIAEKIGAMENKKTLLKDYDNFYLTLNEWCRRAVQDGPK